MSAVFVSYRRDDTRHVAGRLYDRLVELFGPSRVFMDVDSLEPGVDFADAIERAVGACQVQLVLIGRDWLTATDGAGRHRLRDPDDYVALEVSAALTRGIRVIPVLVDGAAVPSRDELPAALVGLARRNGVRLDHESFRTDVQPLLDALRRELEASRQGTEAPSREPRPPQRPDAPARTLPRSGLLGTFNHPGKWGMLGRKSVKAVALSPDDRWLATSSEDKSIRLWDVATGTLARIFDGDGLTEVLEFVDGTRLLGPSGFGQLSVWSCHGDAVPTTFQHDFAVFRAVVSPDRRQLATTGGKEVQLWSIDGGDRVELPHHEYAFSLAFSPDGRWLATASGASVRLWDTGTGREEHMLAHPEKVQAVGYAPDSGVLTTACKDGGVRFSSVARGAMLTELTRGPNLDRFTYSPDGRVLAVNTDWKAKAVELWDPVAGTLKGTIRYDQDLQQMVFSADSRLLAIGSGTKAIKVYDTATGEVAHALALDNSSSALAFSANSRLLAVGTYGNQAVLWNLDQPTM